MFDFLKNKSGATAIEYGLVLCFLSAAMLAVLPLIGTDITKIFQTLSNALAKV